MCTPWQALREAWHRYEAEGVVSVMAEWKASFWEERYDIYNDSPYWVHKWATRAALIFVCGRILTGCWCHWEEQGVTLQEAGLTLMNPRIGGKPW